MSGERGAAMKRTCIITHYYNSKNYGGILQSYAMIKVLSKWNCKPEQLCFDLAEPLKEVKAQKLPPAKRIKNYIASLAKKYINKKRHVRSEAFKKFELKIPHSKRVYHSGNICECADDYEAFITGSDQVWNMEWYYKEYFLSFVPDGKRKIAYAASMPNINLTVEQKKLVCEHLKRFDGISVREKETAPFLEEITGKKVEWVLDPTLLLTRKEWDEICDRRVVKEKYIFCYFLGIEKSYRKTAEEFAKKAGYSIVTLPHLTKIDKNDLTFGDKKLYDISPEQFISLIKYAEYVLTDSFHAAVFSNIYQTKYFVFERNDAGEMSSRIKNLLDLTGETFRFCANQMQNSSYMLSQKDISVSQLSDKIATMRKKSIEFLRENLA